MVLLNNKVMEVNEAPEKIYLDAIYSNNGVLPNGLNYIPSPTDIEYTRTDIFIEKACKLLVDCIEDFMARRMEMWDEDCKKQTLENLRNTLKK